MKPWDQRKDKPPHDLLDDCVLFMDRAKEYLQRGDRSRRRLAKWDVIPEEHLSQ